MSRLDASALQRIEQALLVTGIDPKSLAARKLKPCAEATTLVPVGLGTDGRDKFLMPRAAQGWHAMRSAAVDAGVKLLLVSAFRSIEFQTVLIRNKLQKGAALDEILKVNAPPGYSEHHGGCAIDIGTPESAPLEEAFETTPAFAWLQANAARFGFTLSYPRGNPQGYLYEPWHWCHRRTPGDKRSS
jgi:D-alanyl-D-alanine carboxypeptidase